MNPDNDAIERAVFEGVGEEDRPDLHLVQDVGGVAVDAQNSVEALPQTNLKHDLGEAAVAEHIESPISSPNEGIDTDQPAPEGWLTNGKLAKEIGVAFNTTKKIADGLIEDHPEWFQSFIGAQGRTRTHYHPEAVAFIKEELAKVQSAPEGWMTGKGLSTQLGVGQTTVTRIIDGLKEDHPEWFAEFGDSPNRVNTHMHPDAIDYITAELEGRGSSAPDGWITNSRLAKELGVSFDTASRLANRLKDEMPDDFVTYLDKSGKPSTHYSPAIAKQIRTQLDGRVTAQEGWITNNGLAKELGVSFGTAKKIADSVRDEHPEWFREYSDSKRRPTEHYSPDLVQAAKASIEETPLVPDGWETNSGLATRAGSNFKTVRLMAERLLEEHPEWIKRYTNESGQICEYYNPSLTEIICTELARVEEAPDDWLTNKAFADQLNVAGQTVKKIAETLREEYPELFVVFRASNKQAVEHYSPELQKLIADQINSIVPAPEGWVTLKAIRNEFHLGGKKAGEIVGPILAEHPEWTNTYKDATGKSRTHYSPEIVSAVSSLTEEKREESTAEQLQKELISDVKSYISEISDGTSLDTEEFLGLIELFGAEQVVDILYSYHPEYKKVPVPFVKSIIADYLGEFMFLPGDLQLDKLEISLDLLSDQSLKDRLVEVVKRDCLKFYNQMSRIQGDHTDFSPLQIYIDNLREQTASFTNSNLEEVLSEVEDYYRSLIERFVKPDALLDEISEGRPFPDLNQRINVREIELKHKVLIADEMGVGKSASAILAKESLGVSQALVVAPSNVIEVWLGYLNDYFKDGQAPNVLVVESPQQLEELDTSAYDYVLLSQERLTDKYMPGLMNLGFDMLIVDEVHKLKNVVNGKRAERLLELADKIGGDNQYLAILSGTPVPNKVSDVAVLLKLLYPEQFKHTPNNILTSQILKGDVLDIRSLLVPRMQLKSLSDSVEMPALDERVHVSELSDKEREIYNVLLDEDEFTASEKLQILRKFVLNPRLFDATPEIVGSKAQDVGNELRTAFENKDKVVMFVNGYIEGVIRGEDTIIQDLGVPEGVEVLTIEGKVDKKHRIAIQEQLHQSGKKILLVVSGQTADVGVDFSAADELMFYNEPWTEYDKLQQRGRVYRFGLQGDLKSHTNYVKGTIEEGIHAYIKSKHQAIEKLLRGVPLSEIERELLKHNEKQGDANLEVNPDLAEYYFSSWERMLKIYNFVKQRGEDDFVKFLDKHGKEYADSYTTMGSRSYQANVSRLAGTVIDRQVKSRKQKAGNLKILDVAAGPEILKRHISEPYQDRIVSLDINEHHFADGKEGKKVVGSFVNLPVADKSVDYANLALSLHYSSFVPSRQQFERVEVLRELNRVLTVGGRAVISLMHSLDLKDEQTFYAAVQKLGFRVVKDFTGVVESGNNFKTRLITLEKTEDAPSSMKETAKEMGKGLLNGFKFTKTDVKLRDSRKIVTAFELDGRKIKANINSEDQRVLDEERSITETMTKLKNRFKTIKDIPAVEIQKHGFSRIFNTRGYLLFKQLRNGDGAVIVRQ